jgi:hypothetical protein
MEDEVAAVTSSLRANRGAVNPTRPYPKPTMREAGRGLLRGDEVNGPLKSHRSPTHTTEPGNMPRRQHLVQELSDNARHRGRERERATGATEGGRGRDGAE